jgi:hypothetical protein
MHPIVMVANFSGNVGKTTLTKNLLLPNIACAQVFAVEDVNAGYGQGEAVQLSAQQTQMLLEQVIEASFSRPVVVDVGASNVSGFFAALAEYEGMQDYIAKVVVPVEPSEKVQVDTVSTLRFLVNNLHFEPAKLVLVPNKVPAKAALNTLMLPVMAEAHRLHVRMTSPVPENNTFQIAASLGMTLPQLAQMDPKALLERSRQRSAEGQDPKEGVRLLLACAGAKKLTALLDALFFELELPDPAPVREPASCLGG